MRARVNYELHTHISVQNILICYTVLMLLDSKSYLKYSTINQNI